MVAQFCVFLSLLCTVGKAAWWPGSGVRPLQHGRRPALQQDSPDWSQGNSFINNFKTKTKKNINILFVQLKSIRGLIFFIKI